MVEEIKEKEKTKKLSEDDRRWMEVAFDYAAKALEQHPKVTKVHYPGLPSHPDHANAVTQLKGVGRGVSFAVDGDW